MDKDYYNCSVGIFKERKNYKASTWGYRLIVYHKDELTIYNINFLRINSIKLWVFNVW